VHNHARCVACFSPAVTGCRGVGEGVAHSTLEQRVPPRHLNPLASRHRCRLRPDLWHGSAQRSCGLAPWGRYRPPSLIPGAAGGHRKSRNTLVIGGASAGGHFPQVHNHARCVACFSPAVTGCRGVGEGVAHSTLEQRVPPRHLNPLASRHRCRLRPDLWHGSTQRSCGLAPFLCLPATLHILRESRHFAVRHSLG